MLSSSGSSQARDQTHVSCTVGRFFTAELYGLCAQLLARELHRHRLHLEKLNHLHEEQPGEGGEV